MSEALIHAGVAVYWSFAVVVFVALRETTETRELLAAATFWPIVSVVGIVVLLWRIPFKTAKAIRVDLRNRKLIKEFEQWLDERKDMKDE
jgi:hypothetical protein